VSSTYKLIKRIAIAVAGFTVLLIGVAMIVLPGPAFIVIPAGLGILAIEFAWAKRLLVEARERGAGLLRGRRSPAGATHQSADRR
jgi:tellurite resistance protein TerC